VLWEKEFGREYDIPLEIEALGWTDISWHNDMCPSFTPDPDEDKIRLWVEHPDPNMREYDDQPRYVINRMDKMQTLGYEESIIAAGNDLTEILAVAATLPPKPLKPCRIGRRVNDGVPDVAVS
jgi:hypothetical protein